MVVASFAPAAMSAASAWMRPEPESLSKPGAAMSIAVVCSAVRICAGVSDGTAWNMSAPTPAAWGAAAEVPKKLGKASPSASPPKKLVLAPSGATISGLEARRSGVGSRAPVEPKRIGVVPEDEKNSSTGLATPNAGVCW